jgi:peptidyl-prolyl cis-trans isomerase D
MIQFFRGIFQSKLGLFLSLAFVGLIAIAFASSDITQTGAFGGVTSTGTAAEIGSEELGTGELSQSVNNAFRAAQRENPGLDMKIFVQQGGFEDVLDRLINSATISAFGQKYGVVAGKRLVDSEIAKIPSFQGADGKFSNDTFQMALQQQGLRESQLRDDFVRNLIADQLLPVAGFGVSVPRKLALPYASLVLEKREGTVLIVPSAAFVQGIEPSPAAIAAFYSKNAARYAIPERRSVKYALFSKDRFNETVKASDAEIQKYFTDNKAKYAASETRALEQVIVPTEAAAKALASEVAKGKSLSAAASDVGLSAAELGDMTKAALTSQASKAVADAAFAASSGTISAPAKSPLGWHVVRVQQVKSIKAKSLADVRTEIVNIVTRDKIERAMADLTVTIEDEFANGATLSEVVAAQKLKLESSPLLLADGRDVENQSFQASPELLKVLQAAYASTADDDPQLIEIIPGQQYAVFDIADIAPSAPPPLAKISDLVSRDYILNTASVKAKAYADSLAKRISGGMAISEAVAQGKVSLPPQQRISATRAELAKGGEKVPPPLALMFSMAQKTAKTLKAPQDQGWFVVALNTIVPGDASNRKEIVEATAQQFKQVLATEYTEQFIAAMKKDLGVKRNADAISTLKNQLAGTASAN